MMSAVLLSASLLSPKLWMLKAQMRSAMVLPWCGEKAVVGGPEGRGPGAGEPSWAQGLQGSCLPAVCTCWLLLLWLDPGLTQPRLTSIPHHLVIQASHAKLIRGPVSAEPSRETHLGGAESGALALPPPHGKQSLALLRGVGRCATQQPPPPTPAQEEAGIPGRMLPSRAASGGCQSGPVGAPGSGPPAVSTKQPDQPFCSRMPTLGQLGMPAGLSPAHGELRLAAEAWAWGAWGGLDVLWASQGGHPGIPVPLPRAASLPSRTPSL